MKLQDEHSDALKLIQKIHREMMEVNRDLAELEYLLYTIDERCKIQFFDERGVNDKGRSQKGIASD